MTNYPLIPDKVYFSIGEASRLCNVEQHVLRYWESVFTQLKPAKRSGNRRSYTRSDIRLIRRINDLVHEQGYTLEGAKRYLSSGEARQEQRYSRELARQVRVELEEILRYLR